MRPSTARIPASRATSPATSGKKYISLKQVVPPRSISAAARRVPARTNPSSTKRASAGQTCSSSQVRSGRSSARPRNRVIAAWVWALTSPGTRARPSRCRRSRGENFESSSAAGPIAAMAPSRTARACPSWTHPAGSTGTIHEALNTRSAGSRCSMRRILAREPPDRISPRPSSVRRAPGCRGGDARRRGG